LAEPLVQGVEIFQLRVDLVQLTLVAGEPLCGRRARVEEAAAGAKAGAGAVAVAVAEALNDEPPSC
jgi:hypothetical protein